MRKRRPVQCLIIIISIETKLANAVYSSVCSSNLFYKEALRIKARCFFFKDLLPLTTITDNTVTLLWANNRRKNIQTALKKHLLAQQPEKSTHTPDIRTCKQSFSIKSFTRTTICHSSCTFFCCLFVCFFWRRVHCCLWLCFGCIFLSNEVIMSATQRSHQSRVNHCFFFFNMAVFGSIRSTWNNVITTSFCVHMRVYGRQSVSVSGGWFSCHWSAVLFFKSRKSSVTQVTSSPTVSNQRVPSGRGVTVHSSCLCVK